MSTSRVWSFNATLSGASASAFSSAFAPHYFYRTYGKPLFDLLAAAVGLLLLSPLFLFIAICIKLTPAGPVLFRQPRVGRRGKIFQILKFRTMSHSPQAPGASAAPSTPRVTKIGCLLRHYKLDELPQLWNILRGDMSLVGPRPELPLYVSQYSSAQMRVLSVKPGLTDPASLTYCHEDELLASSPDPDRLYFGKILPDKLHRSLAYLDRMSFTNDLKLIASTLQALLVASSETRLALPHPTCGFDPSRNRR